MLPMHPAEGRELIVNARIALPIRNLRDTAARNDRPYRVRIEVGEKRIRVAQTMVDGYLRLAAERKKLLVDVTAADHPRLLIGSERTQGTIKRMNDLDAVARKERVAREHDVSAVLERAPPGKTLESLTPHDDRTALGEHYEMAHVGFILNDHIAIRTDTPVIADGDDSLEIATRLDIHRAKPPKVGKSIIAGRPHVSVQRQDRAGRHARDE